MKDRNVVHLFALISFSPELKQSFELARDPGHTSNKFQKLIVLCRNTKNAIRARFRIRV